MLLNEHTVVAPDALAITQLRTDGNEASESSGECAYSTELGMTVTHVGACDLDDDSIFTADGPLTLSGRMVGPYRLLEELQTGAIHSVYRGVSLIDGSAVAIKVLHQLSSKGSAARRLQQEWEFIQALHHEHVVQALDFYVGEGELFLVLELLRGPNLEQYVGSHGPLDGATAASILLQAAAGLAYAHEHGLTHRDIKPANFCFDADGQLKVIDFGVTVDQTAESSVTLEHHDRLIGTVNYMAPEQALDAHLADERSDVYALGCTLYFLLTGHPPFDHGTAAQRLLMHRNEQPESIHRFRPEAPAELVALCERMMAKEPADRVQTMAEVAQTLTQWLARD